MWFWFLGLRFPGRGFGVGGLWFRVESRVEGGLGFRVEHLGSAIYEVQAMLCRFWSAGFTRTPNINMWSRKFLRAFPLVSCYRFPKRMGLTRDMLERLFVFELAFAA